MEVDFYIGVSGWIRRNKLSQLNGSIKCWPNLHPANKNSRCGYEKKIGLTSNDSKFPDITNFIHQSAYFASQ